MVYDVNMINEFKNSKIIVNSINDDSLKVVEDLITIIHCFSSRVYGLRKYEKN
jgi:predicted site-specific integrase-resolvase